VVCIAESVEEMHGLTESLFELKKLIKVLSP